MSENVVRARRLRKSFGATVAVDGLDLEVSSGTVYGLVGPNGAGKTTTISMLTGLLRPDSGHVTVGGFDVWQCTPRALALLGVLPNPPLLLDRLTGSELVVYTARLHGVPTGEARRRSEELLDLLDMNQAAHSFIGEYSTGMRKKVGLACALAHGPRVLVLDEPFEALDPGSARVTEALLRDFAARGGTAIISSHALDVVERICDDVGLISGGRLLAGGPMAEVIGAGTLTERFHDLVPGSDRTAPTLRWWQPAPPPPAPDQAPS